MREAEHAVGALALASTWSPSGSVRATAGTHGHINYEPKGAIDEMDDRGVEPKSVVPDPEPDPAPPVPDAGPEVPGLDPALGTLRPDDGPLAI